MKRSITYFSTIILISTLFGCGQEKSQVNETQTISKIVIQIFPAFYTHSQFLLDIKNPEMVFDMIGDVRFIKVDANYDMKPFYYKFNSEESKYLNDSILAKFNTKDYSNSYYGVTDGIGIDILYVFSDGKSKKIELSNSSTLNQSKLISFLLESIINNSSDSTTIAYSELINKYY